jgi:O-methyltransferase involved in polyketide biosynthesis
VFLDAAASGAGHIVNVGCGSDTRAMRFAHYLQHRSVTVLECDQAESIENKRRIVAALWPTDHVEYLALDLNDPGAPPLRDWMERHRGTRMLVMLEGVSPYVESGAFRAFLQMLSSELAPGSRLAYDFKVPGVAQGFGVGGRTKTPFRLEAEAQKVAELHREYGFRLEQMETSAQLSRRLVPDERATESLFEEDVLVQLSVP